MKDYAYVRGFNYQPGYARNGLNAWLDRFDARAIEREVGLGKRYFPGINTLRIWLSHEAFVLESEKTVANFETVLEIVSSQGLKVIPVLFNGWHSFPDFGGICLEQIVIGRLVNVFKPYVDAIVGPRAVDDRVLLWDLCNEPFNSLWVSDARAVMIDWLFEIRAACKSVRATASISVSASHSTEHLRLLEPISDVLTFHPYYAWNLWVPDRQQYTDSLDAAVELSAEVGKPLLSTETCWGALDDKQRADNIAFELSEMKKRGIGWIAHIMNHSQVADAHRRWTSPSILAGYMAFIEADGSIRPHHKVFNEY